jgi:hypothetical protein
MNSSWCGWRASSVLIRETDLGAGPDGLTPVETLTAVSKQVHDLAEEQHPCFLNILMPQLSAARLVRRSDRLRRPTPSGNLLSPAEKSFP